MANQIGPQLTLLISKPGIRTGDWSCSMQNPERNEMPLRLLPQKPSNSRSENRQYRKLMGIIQSQIETSESWNTDVI